MYLPVFDEINRTFSHFTSFDPLLWSFSLILPSVSTLVSRVLVITCKIPHLDTSSTTVHCKYSQLRFEVETQGCCLTSGRSNFLPLPISISQRTTTDRYLTPGTFIFVYLLRFLVRSFASLFIYATRFLVLGDSTAKRISETTRIFCCIFINAMEGI